MKQDIQMVMGYIGYFLIGYMALRALLVQDDRVGFALLFIGMSLLMSCVQFFEKKQGNPKYSVHIKVVLSLVLILTTLPMVY
ncbi:hypothetical protein JMA_09290 [Jeotgalibacillus malaysiensis]|uniref:Uncharacterized protein n=1 Tax=Jeotgalibacillus malaysiensis TaxID=1508404 RepID=A0A0B5AJM0_9BACL|nr:hypothetical protein [Jeotgalibacillus malaysiensis]AJD90246.1 hypothetical protein JMA_09290 [Jeotgalibacillus malaysiensis]